MEPQLFLGIDVGKTDHHATAVNHDGQIVHDKPLPQSEPKIQQLLNELAIKHGELFVVVAQPKPSVPWSLRWPNTWGSKLHICLD